jgi:hypothetical protein
MKNDETPEVFTIKIEIDGKMVWHKKNGRPVEITRRKALRNYIRNNLQYYKVSLFLNGSPFEFGQGEPLAGQPPSGE